MTIFYIILAAIAFMFCIGVVYSIAQWDAKQVYQSGMVEGFRSWLDTIKEE